MLRILSETAPLVMAPGSWAVTLALPGVRFHGVGCRPVGPVDGGSAPGMVLARVPIAVRFEQFPPRLPPGA